jgi:hypothetical protein
MSIANCLTCRIRKDIIEAIGLWAFIIPRATSANLYSDDPYSLDQLRDPRINVSIVRPLVDRLHELDDVSVSKLSLLLFNSIFIFLLSLLISFFCVYSHQKKDPLFGI